MHYYLLPLVFGGINKEQKITNIDLKFVYCDKFHSLFSKFF